MKIAVVTSSTHLFGLVCKCFEVDGISCFRFDDQLKIARSIRSIEFSAILVDASGSVNSILSLFMYLTSRLGSKTPVILLNVRDDRHSIVEAFEVGANDIVLAPASIGELYARTISALRHGRSISVKGSIILGPYVVDRNSRSVMINSRCVKLTGKEFEIAWLLFSHKNEEVNRRQISMAVWGTSEDVVGRSIEQYVYRLRSKLNLDGEFGVRLETLYARGYKVSEVNCNR